MIWISAILARNLAIVFITELSFAWCLGARSGRKIITTALVNIITNPAVVLSRLCLTLFFNPWELVGIVFLELIAVAAEGYMFSKFKTFDKKNPYVVSFVLNLASFLTGEIINIII